VEEGEVKWRPGPRDSPLWAATPPLWPKRSHRIRLRHEQGQGPNTPWCSISTSAATRSGRPVGCAAPCGRSGDRMAVGPGQLYLSSAFFPDGGWITFAMEPFRLRSSNKARRRLAARRMRQSAAEPGAHEHVDSPGHDRRRETPAAAVWPIWRLSAEPGRDAWRPTRPLHPHHRRRRDHSILGRQAPRRGPA
jgi:hypothetical protein